MFNVKICKYVFQITVGNRKKEETYKELFSGFITDETPDIKIYVRLIDNLRYDDYRGRSTAARKDKNVYELKWYYFRGRFDRSRGIVRADVSSTPHVLGSLLRIVCAIKIIGSGGIFVHAASFIKGKKAYIFPGKSGAGKSTLIRMVMNTNPEIDILSDEISCLLVEKEKVYAYSTPFWGNAIVRGRYLRAPLEAIYLINKAKKNSIKTISDRDAIQHMLTNVLFATIDGENFIPGIKTIETIVKKTRCGILNFKKDSSFLRII